MVDLTTLTAAVTKETSLGASAITLIDGLAAQIAALKTPAAVALAAQVSKSSHVLASAMIANTGALV